MEVGESILNSCRVCRSANNDGDFECLLENGLLQLAEAGLLYEELLGIQIDMKTAQFYPQYLCNSCHLLMKLFRKLKTRANQTMETLTAKYLEKDEGASRAAEAQLKMEGLLEITDRLSEAEPIESQSVGYEREAEKRPYLTQLLEQEEQQTCQEHVDEIKLEFLSADEEELESHLKLSLDGQGEEDLGSVEIIETFECDDQHQPQQQFKTTLMAESDSGSVEADVYELDDAAGILKENSNDSSETTGNATGAQTVFTDVHYLEDALDNPVLNEFINEHFSKQKCELYKRSCRFCKKDFHSKAEFVKHKKEMHSVKYPCAVCGKIFQTTDAYNVHQKLHSGQRAFKCELCGKTFNQKVHYNYHMAKHNNIRNFKCEICGKAFIAKGDLGIHIRTHTGDRRYSCDVCNKEFLLLVHMKNHRYSHFDKEFECNVCQQKFVSPSTLRTHVQTIHENEPRFQCAYCVKKFRRKAHLIAHYKVHRKTHEFDEYLENYDDEILRNDTVVHTNNQVNAEELVT